MNGLAVLFVVLVVAVVAVVLVRSLDAELDAALADRRAMRAIDRRPPAVEPLPPAVTGLRPAPRPYDWQHEPAAAPAVRLVRGGAA